MANRTDRAGYEALTVPKLQQELRDRTLDDSGLKGDLVDRLVADDEDKMDDLLDEAMSTEPEPEPDEPEATELRGQREQREVHAGGHTILVDVDPPTPEAMDNCSVCGAKAGECVHSQVDYGRTWDVAEPAPVEPTTDSTFWPDETVGSRSAEQAEEE